MEITRMEHYGVNYILNVDIVMWGDIKVVYPAISITTRSAKKGRDKKLSDNYDMHFNLLEVKEPITLVRKISKGFERFLKDYDYIVFSAWSDKRHKREELYIKILESFGFRFVYNHTVKGYDVSDFLMVRDTVTPPRRKIIKTAFDVMYAHLD